jgi:hypothetical protein
MIALLKNFLSTFKATSADAWDFHVIRHLETATATYGQLYDRNGVLVCVTVERPWVDKDKNGKRDTGVSRFVAGVYSLFLRLSKLHGGTGKRPYDVWQFENVPDVEAAQVHIANRADQLEGCIGVGMSFDMDGDMPIGVKESKIAFDKFMALTKGKSKIRIKVSEAFGAAA